MSFFDVFNLYGLGFAVLLLLPHILFRRSHKIDKGIYTNKAMLYIDRIGRYMSLFLMAVNIGVLEKGFPKPKLLMERYWLISTAVLCLVYLLLWFFFFKNERKGIAYAIAGVSAAVVIFSGLLQVKTLLLTAGIVYLIGELYIISCYFKNKM